MSEDNKAALFFAALIAVAFIGFMIGGGVAWGSAQDHWQNDAVKHGAAEYYLDAKNERQWRWIGESK